MPPLEEKGEGLCVEGGLIEAKKKRGCFRKRKKPVPIWEKEPE